MLSQVEQLIKSYEEKSSDPKKQHHSGQCHGETKSDMQDSSEGANSALNEGTGDEESCPICLQVGRGTSRCWEITRSLTNAPYIFSIFDHPTLSVFFGLCLMYYLFTGLFSQRMFSVNQSKNSINIYNSLM